MKMQDNPSFRIQTLLIVLVLGACLISCSRGKGEADGSAAGGAPVQVIHPRVLDFTETINLNANTVFLTKEVVRATFQGFIEKIYKTIGDEVRAGDLLFRIKTKELSTDDSLQIDLGTDLFKGAVAVRAKTNGILTALNYNVGDFVSDGEQIAVVSNPSSLCIQLNVPYPTVSHIRPGARCDLFLPNGNILHAWIHKFIPSVDPMSQTQTVLLRLSSAVALPENLNVNVRLPLQTAKHVVGVPKSAVMSDETLDRFWVMKLVNDSTAVRVDVQKGIENDSLVQIIRPPLGPKDRIVSEGAYGLPDTAKVSIGR